MNCFPKNSYVESITPNITIFGDKTFKEVNKIIWGHTVGTLIQQNWYAYKNGKKHQGCALTEKVMWGHSKKAAT